MLVIESNRYREKTWDEKLKEAEALEKILKPKAKEKQIEGGKDKVVQNSEQPPSERKVLMQAAEVLGTSHDTLYKVKTIEGRESAGLASACLKSQASPAYTKRQKTLSQVTNESLFKLRDALGGSENLKQYLLKEGYPKEEVDNLRI